MSHYYHPEAKDRYRQIYFEAFDLVVNCVQRRFDQPDFQTYVHLQEVFLKTIKGEPVEEHFRELESFYSTDFNVLSLKPQLEVLPNVVESMGFNRSTFSVSDLVRFLQKLDPANKLLLSEVVKLGKLMLVMPATNAVSERSFSALKRLKTYLRSTTSHTRLNNFLVLHIHKNKTDELDISKVADEFIARRTAEKVYFHKISCSTFIFVYAYHY